MRDARLRTAVLTSMICATAVLSVWSGAARAQPQAGGAADLVLSAIGLLGTPYRHGGDRPDSGFDCSGLVRYVARSALGVDLPRRAEAIGRLGIEVDPRQMQPGDLVFFNTLGRPFSHVGFYLGDGQFVHAPAQRGQVRIEQMSLPYWQSRFDGVRRLGGLADGQAAPGFGAGLAGRLPTFDAPFLNVGP